MAITSGEDGSSIPKDGGRSSSSSAGFLAGQPPLPPSHTKWPTEKSTARDPAEAKVPSLRLLLAACQKEVNLVSEKISLFENQKSEEFGLLHYPVRPLPLGSGSNWWFLGLRMTSVVIQMQRRTQEYERKLSECENMIAELRPKLHQLLPDTRRIEIKVRDGSWGQEINVLWLSLVSTDVVFLLWSPSFSSPISGNSWIL